VRHHTSASAEPVAAGRPGAYSWEAELMASLERLVALQRGLEVQVSRLNNLERELESLRPARDVA